MIDFLDNKQKKQQFCFSYTTFLLNGMLALSIGSLLPFIRDAKGLPYAFCGLLVSIHSVGNLISSFFAGTFAVWIGRKKSILLFNAFFAIAYLLIILGNNELCLLLAFTMTGLARGATSNFCNTTINNLAPGKAWSINALHGMFSMGAFLFPILLTVLTANDNSRWIYACFFMLAMGILSWLLYFLMPVEEGFVQKKEKGGTFGFFKEPMFIMCTATLFFYLCVEQGVIGWMITYFKDTGLLSPSLSQITASVLWVMILAGRLTTAWLSTRMEKEKLLRIMGVGLVLFFLVLITGRSTPWIVVGIMGFGYSMAGIYPTTVSFSGEIIQKYPLAWSFILTFASIGSIVMPSVIGKIADVMGIFYGMSSIVVVVIIDMVCIAVLTTYVIKRKKNALKKRRKRMKNQKNQIWNYNNDIDLEECGKGVCRKILAYTDELMCVENHFEKGGVGALHHHPHTQITYVVSGKFEFEIDGVKKVVCAGDTMLKKDSIEHGCVCLEEGVLLDIFTPMRQEFV